MDEVVASAAEVYDAGVEGVEELLFVGFDEVFEHCGGEVHS